MVHGETGKARAGARAPALSSGISLRAIGTEVLGAVANAAPHDVSIFVLRVATATVALSGGVLSLSFSFAFEVGQRVIMCPEEAFASSFPVSFDLLDGFAKPANGFACVAAPSTLSTPILQEDVGSSF